MTGQRPPPGRPDRPELLRSYSLDDLDQEPATSKAAAWALLNEAGVNIDTTSPVAGTAGTRLDRSGLPRRVQLRRSAGWRLPTGVVIVDRRTVFGNPFTVTGARAAGWDSTTSGLRSVCVDAFGSWLHDGPTSPWWHPSHAQQHATLWARLGELTGRDLACWCPLGEPCHADVLLTAANTGPAGTEPRTSTPSQGPR
jgi:hypothetical protein